jgi:nucleoside-triphosphatase THEP1
MNDVQHLSDKWIKASILGTIWASSEIVLGSFLHNLRVPFSGNILTAIGLVILISASYKWKEHGLFWRAGVICALLKTMSPSAVIFGPMVAIFSEAILLEVSVRILGRTIPGFVLGSILAMSWNLLQKIFNFVIFYGYNIVEVYTNLMKYAEQQLNLQFDAVWTPLVLLLIIYALFGVASALMGIRTGREMAANPTPFRKLNVSNKTENSRKKDNKFNYSGYWLIFNVMLMAGSLLLIGRINFAIWVAIVISIATTWALRYKRALRQLIRPRLWIFFVAITMITAFVFTRLQTESKTLTDAFLIGIEMNLRAIILIMGFTVLGTELYNPKIRDYFSQSYFKELPLALELSLESLPAMIANTPSLKTIIKNPTLFVHHIMSFAELRINEIKNQATFIQKIFIVSGGIGQGKTTCIKNLLENFQKGNIPVSGIYSSRLMEKETTTGYDIVTISTNQAYKFLRNNGDSSQSKIGNFYIYEEGLMEGNRELQINNSQIIIIDEVGKLELSEKGWFDAVKHLIENPKNHLILSVRDDFVTQVVERFRIRNTIILNVSEKIQTDFYSTIIAEIKS